MERQGEEQKTGCQYQPLNADSQVEEEIKQGGSTSCKKRISLGVRGAEAKLVWVLHRIKLCGMLHLHVSHELGRRSED